MKILGIDSTAKTASVGITEDNKVIDHILVNQGLTHSETLLPLIDNILKKNNLTIDDMDAFAVNNGPGSFTGVRIGVAVVKGLAFKSHKPCFEVSTLDSIAYNCKSKEGMVVSVIDARRNQMYNALYTSNGDSLTRLTEDRSLLIEDLYKDIKDYSGKVYIVGDGQENVKAYFESNNMSQDNFIYPEYLENLQKGSNTALIAYNNLNKKKTGEEILPSYLKLPQAEQELRKKRGL
jgi:tRNA threonylcarbamoyladenosine biosynthesis protein TsaB